MKRNRNRSICDHIPGSRSVTTNFLDQFCDHKLPDDCDHRRGGRPQGCDHKLLVTTSGPGDVSYNNIRYNTCDHTEDQEPVYTEGRSRSDCDHRKAAISNGIPFISAYLNRKTRGKHAKCPYCSNLMRRLYIKNQICKRASWVAVGWICLNCLYIRLEADSDGQDV